MFRTATADPALQDLGEALDPVVLDELGKHQPLVQVTARPPLDLPATQLALDCVGETNACLREAATQAGVDVLIAPSLERAGDETVVTLMYFDARGAGELRNAARRHRGATSSARRSTRCRRWCASCSASPSPRPSRAAHRRHDARRR